MVETKFLMADLNMGSSGKYDENGIRYTTHA